MTWSVFSVKEKNANLLKSFCGLQGSSLWLFAVKGIDGCGHVTDDFVSCCDEFSFDSNILQTKDIAISFLQD